MATRKTILDGALKLVDGERDQVYGDPKESFSLIADLWTAFLSHRPQTVSAVALSPAEVALMMDLLKTARLARRPGHLDSWIDKAGYAACGGEVACPTPAPPDPLTSPNFFKGPTDAEDKS